VTGASRGIGKGIAIELGREGAIVYVTGTSTTGSVYPYHQSLPYVTSEECGGPGTIEETAAAVTAAGGFGISLYCNHAVDADVKNVMDVIASRHGRLDILINNVFRLPPGGAAQLKKKFWEQGPAVWDCVHTVGLRSHYVASCYAMPLLLASKIRQQGGFLPRPFIGMISSFGGMSYTFNVPYGVGKAGVDRLAKDMAVELEEFDICVTSLYPGLVNTERTQASVANGEWGTHVGLPLDNAETPAFTGRAVVALATDRSNRKKYSGTVQVVAELAEKYGFTDIDGRRPPSIRSLRFLWHTYGMNDTQRKTISPQWLPNVKLPFWALSGGKATEKQK
jgi:dehydrogenase/reductase SDR family protein 1